MILTFGYIVIAGQKQVIPFNILRYGTQLPLITLNYQLITFYKMQIFGNIDSLSQMISSYIIWRCCSLILLSIYHFQAMFLIWLILVYKKNIQKQPFTQFTQIFRGRNQFFRTPRVNLRKNDHFLFDFHISAWLNRLISRFTQICPNS